MIKKPKSRALDEILGDWKNKADKAIGKSQKHEHDNKIIKLPACKDSERTIPNIIARSALFGVIKRGARTYKDKELIASRSDVKIYYTGKTLDQADCTVWMQALAFTNILGQDIPVNRASFLKLLGKTTGKKDYLWLDSSLHRLMTGVVTVEAPNGKLEFHLIEAWGEITDDNNLLKSSYVLNINPKVVKMWANSQYVKVEWDKRLAIKRGCDLASWMQLYIHSNAETEKPTHISLKNLKLWCGRKESPLRKFRVAMQSALVELVRIGEIRNASIRTKDDMVIFTRVSENSENFLIDRDSKPVIDRDSKPVIDRDSKPVIDRDSKPVIDRDSKPLDRDSKPLDRDSKPLDRDSKPDHKNKYLFLRNILALFSS